MVVAWWCYLIGWQWSAARFEIVCRWLQFVVERRAVIGRERSQLNEVEVGLPVEGCFEWGEIGPAPVCLRSRWRWWLWSLGSRLFRWTQWLLDQLSYQLLSHDHSQHLNVTSCPQWAACLDFLARRYFEHLLPWDSCWN